MTACFINADFKESVMSSIESVVRSSQRNGVRDAARPGRGIGVMFLAFFGTLWLILGSLSVPGVTWPLLAVLAAVGAGIFLTGLRLTVREAAAGSSLSESEQARRRRVFRNVNLLQWGAIVAWIVLLNVIGHVEWITPGIMFIVGVHFLPLAALFKNRATAVTGVAFACLAMIYPFVADGGPTSAVGPVCAGLMLWSAALAMLVEVARRR
jgi:hypothetical protein